MKTILERLNGLTTTQLINISETDKSGCLYSDERNKLINEIDAAIYCSDIDIVEIIQCEFNILLNL